jgi:CheY-like chemotaxis protein
MNAAGDREDALLSEGTGCPNSTPTIGVEVCVLQKPGAGMSDRIRILVADDHPLMRSGIAAEINAEPDMSVVASAGNGEEALTLFRAHRPDVSLIDLRMPKMNGLDLLSAIRADFPNARLIILTTFSATFMPSARSV